MTLARQICLYLPFNNTLYDRIDSHDKRFPINYDISFTHSLSLSLLNFLNLSVLNQSLKYAHNRDNAHCRVYP